MAHAATRFKSLANPGETPRDLETRWISVPRVWHSRGGQPRMQATDSPYRASKRRRQRRPRKPDDSLLAVSLNQGILGTPQTFRRARLAGITQLHQMVAMGFVSGPLGVCRMDASATLPGSPSVAMVERLQEGIG